MTKTFDDGRDLVWFGLGCLGLLLLGETALAAELGVWFLLGKGAVMLLRSVVGDAKGGGK